MVCSVLKALSHENYVAMVYVHSGVSPFKKGGLAMVKLAYMNLPPRSKERCNKIYVVQPSFYSKTRITFAERCAE